MPSAERRCCCWAATRPGAGGGGTGRTSRSPSSCTWSTPHKNRSSRPWLSALPLDWEDLERERQQNDPAPARQPHRVTGPAHCALLTEGSPWVADLRDLH